MTLNKRLLSWTALAVLLLAGLHLRLSGIAAPSLHPDESTIGRWIAMTAEHGEIRDRLYPGGFFVLAAPIRRAAQAWQSWRAADAVHRGAADRVAVSWDDIRFARHLNVALALLTGLCIYALARRITGSRLAALAAAAFCMFDSVHVEHSHYAETDVAMLAALSLTLLAWARARYTGQALYLLAAAAAAGFAAGTKFTLAFLLVPTLVMPFLSREEEDRGRRSLLRVFALLLLSLLLFGLLFAWTNPVILRLAEFRAASAQQARGLLTEMHIAMGPAADTLGGRLAWKFRLLVLHALAMGPFFLALAGGGFLAVLAMPDFRRAWPLLILVPLLLLAVFLGAAPFIRKQEFMTFLPFLAILAAIPLALPLPQARVGRWIMRAGLAVLALAALDRALLDARRVSGLFGWKDPRLMARDWTDRHAPDNQTAAIEHGARPAAGDAYARVIPLYKLEDIHQGLTLLDRLPADYLYRNLFAKGRGFAEPGSDRLRPRHDALLTRFEARATPLLAWTPFTFPRANASHAGHAVALYALDCPGADLSLNLRLADPVLISEAGRETAFPNEGRLGGREAVLVTTRPRDLAVGGPGSGIRRIGITLHTAEREADIRLRAWGRTTRVTLPPHSVRMVELVKPRWCRTPEPYARLRAWSAPLKGLDSPPCWLRLGRAQAVETGYTLGDAPQTLARLTNRDLASPLDLFRFSVRAADWALAAETQSDARTAFDTLEAALAKPPEALSINGIPGGVYNDFARLRTVGAEQRDVALFSDRARKHDAAFRRAIRESLLLKMGKDPATACFSESPFVPPFHLAQGLFTLRLDVRPLRDDGAEPDPNPESDRYAFTDARGQTLAEGRWSDLPRDRDTRLAIPVAAGREAAPELFLHTSVPRVLLVRRAELVWTLRDRLQAVRHDLLACFARFALQQGDPTEALLWLDRVVEPAWNGAELARLRRLAEGPVTAPESRGFRFTPAYRLVRHKLDPAGGAFRVTLAALRDDTPPHELQLVRRQQNRWKAVAAAPLHPDRYLMEDDRETVTLRLPKISPAHLGLRVRTAILSRPGALGVNGSSETVLPLSELLVR